MQTFIVLAAIMATALGSIFSFVLGCSIDDPDPPPQWIIIVLALSVILMYVVVFFAGFYYAKLV